MIHMAMVKDQMYGKTMRKSYAKYQEILDMPNMLKIQKDSYQWFLDEGLREVFKDVGSITDFSGKLELSFLDPCLFSLHRESGQYMLGFPKIRYGTIFH